MARTKKPKPKSPARDYSPDLASAMVLTGEATRRRFGANIPELQIVQRCVVQSMYLMVMMNATACANERIRVLRPASAGAKSIYRGRRLGRKAMRYAKGEMAIMPSPKALAMAHDADDIEEVMEGPACELIRKPDPFASGRDWWLSLYTSLEMIGEGFCWAGERRNGVPVSLYTLQPQYSRIQPSPESFVDGLWFGRNRTEEKFFPIEDVWYTRHRPDPITPYRGTCWPRSVVLNSDMENGAVAAEVARWSNGGTPGLVFSMDKDTNETTRKQAESQINAYIRGVNNTGKTLVLVATTPVATGWSPKDMMYEAGLKHAFNAIRMAAGPIPEALFTQGSTSYAAAYRSDPQFMGMVVAPRINKVADELTEFCHANGLLPLDHWLEYDCPVAEDQKAMEDSSRADVAGGILTVNEARASRGYEARPEEEADVLCYQGVPLNVKATPPAPPMLPQDGTGKPAPSDAGGGGSKEPAKPADRAAGDDAAAGGDKAAEAPKPKPVLPARRKSDLGGQPSEVTRAMDAMQGQLQDWYRRAFEGGVNELGSINIEHFMPELRAIMAAHLPAITEAGARDAASSIGTDFVPNYQAVEWARSQGSRLVTQVSDSMKEALANRVADGLAAGSTTTQIQHAIREEAPEFSATRAEVIARTETAQAANHGAIVQMKDSGVEWKDFIVGRCPACLAIKAKYPAGIAVDAQWVDAEGNAYDEPPFHPQCICTAVPSTKPVTTGEPDATP